MISSKQERILIVGDNSLFLERIALELRPENFDVVATESGLYAFQIMRICSRPIDWLFTRASLFGSIDE